MDWLVISTILFSLLTLYFTYIEYRDGKATKKHFRMVLVLELLAIIGMSYVLFA